MRIPYVLSLMSFIKQRWMKLILMMMMIQRLVTVLKQTLVTVVKQRLVTVVKQRLVTGSQKLEPEAGSWKPEAGTGPQCLTTVTSLCFTTVTSLCFTTVTSLCFNTVTRLCIIGASRTTYTVSSWLCHEDTVSPGPRSHSLNQL